MGSMSYSACNLMGAVNPSSSNPMQLVLSACGELPTNYFSS